MKLVILTGAGMSAESGIKTFRDSDGLWENYRIEDVCTPEALARNPELVNQFYRQFNSLIFMLKSKWTVYKSKLLIVINRSFTINIKLNLVIFI